MRIDVKAIVWPLLGLLARLDQPWLAGQVLRLITRRLSIPSHAPTRPQYRVLALNVNKSGGLEDIEESFRDAAKFDVIAWPSYALRPMANVLLSPELDHNNYLTDDPNVEGSKDTYRRFLKNLWRHFRPAMKIDAVIASNFSYCHQREFGAALEELGTPFIAIHKENVRPPKRVKEYWTKLYKEHRGPFAGRKILVYNEIERNLEVSTDVAEPGMIEVTGMPRLDKLHRWRRKHAGPANPHDELQVLFFAFSRQNKLSAPGKKQLANASSRGFHSIDGDWGRLGWDQMWCDSHKAMIDVARANPDIRVIIKFKSQLRKSIELQELLQSGEESLPPNLEVVAGGDPFELIVASQVVVGFNTTGLLEAVAAGKLVVVPRFLEAAAEERRDLVIELGDAALYPGSREELARLVSDLARSRPPVPEALAAPAMETLRYWVGNDDGAAGARVFAAIQQEIAPVPA